MAKKKLPAGLADISLPLFMVAAKFCGNEEERIGISGVFVQPHPKGGVVLVATDGHRMIVLHDTHGKCSRPMALAAKAGLKLARKMNQNIENQETRWRVIDGKERKGFQRVPLVNYPYPDWAKMPSQVANSRGGATHTINPKYVADFMRAGIELQKCRNPTVVIAPGKHPHDPVLILFPDAPHAFAIIMPMVAHSGSGLPAFMRTLMPRAKKKKGARI